MSKADDLIAEIERQDEYSIRNHMDSVWKLCDESKAMKGRIAELEQAQRWIPLTERLPENDSLVVAAKMYGQGIEPDTAVCWFINYQFHAETDGLDASNHDGGACITLDITPTHWLPLPGGI